MVGQQIGPLDATMWLEWSINRPRNYQPVKGIKLKCLIIGDSCQVIDELVIVDFQRQALD